LTRPVGLVNSERGGRAGPPLFGRRYRRSVANRERIAARQPEVAAQRRTNTFPSPAKS